jgi:hypothetical protein
MRLICATILCLFLLPASLAAQTVYNPPGLEFEQDDYALVTSYIVQWWADPPGAVPLFSATVPASKTRVNDPGPPVRYLLPFDALPPQPVGRSYRFTLISVNAEGLQSEVSNLTPNVGRWSSCLGPSGGVRPMTLTLGALPPLTAGAWVSLQVDVESPLPVHAVSLDLIGDNSPAWYFISGADLRAGKPFAIGPLPRAGRYLLVLEATDEQGCHAQVADTYLVVK